MPTRRDFHRLTVGAAAGAAVPVTLWPGTIAQAAPVPGPGAVITVEETATQVVVDNGPVRLVIGKANNGRATSLRFNGQELMANGGMGYYDVNSEALGTPVPLPPTVAAYSVRQGPDFVDVACTIGPTAGGPFTTVRHYIVRAGEPGIHLATEFHHTPDAHGFRAAQHRFVLRVDPTLFTHASVEDDAVGAPWRAAAAVLPTPAELRAAPEVMDATDDLAGLGSAYPRRYYTKYDWAVYLKDHRVHGLYGNGYGVWAVLANLEAFAGGPTRQDLTLHQTNTTPVLLVEPQATHYGSPAIEVNGAWSKTYGPYYLHLNTGTDPAAMRADALRHADPKCHREFYDRVALPGWVPSADRVTVTGRVRIPGRHNMAGAVAVLSDNHVDFQRTVHGYQYWADVNVSGSFRLSGVRPGTYRLSVYRPGVWGEYVRDDVV
ncbi:MAG TPA: twin-arginine translocation signal domain-containing protein, partial [Catenuloplanes sp.]